jgi:Sulfotransferase domain
MVTLAASASARSGEWTMAPRADGVDRGRDATLAAVAVVPRSSFRRALGIGRIGMTLKVIGAGFGRTGTLTLKLALEQLGFGPCYHMVEVFKNPQAIGWWLDAANGKPDSFRCRQTPVPQTNPTDEFRKHHESRQRK